MGLFEYLRVQIKRITGRDPEENDSGLYKFYSASGPGAPALPAAGSLPFKNFAISPVQGPPGMCYDPSGAVRYIHDASGRVMTYSIPYSMLSSATVDASQATTSYTGSDGAGNILATVPLGWRSFTSAGNQTNLTASPVAFTDEAGSAMAAPGAGLKWQVGDAYYCCDVGAVACTMIIRTSTTDSAFTSVIIPVAGGACSFAIFRKAKDVNETLEACISAPPGACNWAWRILARIVPA